MAKPVSKKEPTLDRELKEFRNAEYRSKKEAKKIAELRKLRRKQRRVLEKRELNKLQKEI